MFLAMIGYLFFCLCKYRKIDKRTDQKQRHHFEFAIIGMFIGFVIGCIASPKILRVIFSENFLKAHVNPDLGMAAYYILVTFILTIIFSMITPLIYNLIIEGSNKN